MGARRTTGARRAPSGAESARAFGVVLERIESQMTAVVEAVTSATQRLDAKIDALGAHLSERISVLEQVVRQNSLDIRQNSEDILALRNEVALLRHDFDHREERGRVDALEARVAALEARLGVA